MTPDQATPDRLFAEPALAALYDLMCPRNQRSDFDFYLPLVMKANAVLDVGCGTGAMLHEARQAGHTGRLCGLDPAPGMLTEARKHPGIEWHLGDLASAKFDAEFDLVVMTGHAFQVLVEDRDLRSTLAAIRAALAANGHFAFETRNPLAREWERWTPHHPLRIRGTDVRMVRQVTVPFDGRTITFTHTFNSPAWSQPQISQSTLRFLDRPTLVSFLGEAGFAIEAQFGDWDRTPVTDHSPEIITMAGPQTRSKRPSAEC